MCCNEDWYLENLKTIDKNKDAAELIQGKLIVEFNELLAVKSAIEASSLPLQLNQMNTAERMPEKVKSDTVPVYLLVLQTMPNF